MAGFPESIGSRFVRTLAVILLALALVSCSRSTVLVVSDPYIDIVEGSKWGPSTRLFRLRAALRGYRVEHVKTDTQTTLRDILNERSSPVEALVLSPWNSSFPENLGVSAERIYVFGNPAAAETVNTAVKIIRINGEKAQALRELGRIAGRVAVIEKKGAVALLSESRNYRPALQDGYRESGGEAYPIRFFDTISKEYQEASADCPVLVLLAGPANLEALALSAEAATPLISEFIINSNAWSQRIIAGLEDNPRKRDYALLASLGSQEPESVENYDMRVLKGILFKKYRR